METENQIVYVSDLVVGEKIGEPPGLHLRSRLVGKVDRREGWKSLRGRVIHLKIGKKS